MQDGPFGSPELQKCRVEAAGGADGALLWERAGNAVPLDVMGGIWQQQLTLWN